MTKLIHTEKLASYLVEKGNDFIGVVEHKNRKGFFIFEFRKTEKLINDIYQYMLEEYKGEKK